MHTDPLEGQVLDGRYAIVCRIASGASSTVYKARHIALDTTVALKMLHKSLMGDPKQLRRFQREAKAASSLSHEYIVPVRAFGITPDGQPYIVMDFVDGPTLREFLDKEGHLKLSSALEVFKQIAGALEEAHRHGLVHRDIKPSNILIEEINSSAIKVRLSDFGIATMISGSGAQTASQLEVVGSPLYMSPEQCRGKRADPRSDIYSLGCLMYEALSGQTPFAGEDALTVMSRHCELPVPPLVMLGVHGVPQALEDVIRKCLQKHPSERYQTASEIIYALSHIDQDNGPITLVPATARESQKQMRPWQLPVLMIFCLVVAAAFVLTSPSVQPAILEYRLKQTKDHERRVEIWQELIAAYQHANNKKKSTEAARRFKFEMSQGGQSLDLAKATIVLAQLLQQGAPVEAAEEYSEAVSCLESLAGKLSDKKEYRAAAEYLQLAEHTALLAFGNTSKKHVRLLEEYARMVRLTGDKTKALALFKQALAASELMVPKDYPGRAWLLTDLGALSYSLDDKMRYYNRALTAREGDPDATVQLLTHIAGTWNDYNRKDLALANLTKAIQLGQASGVPDKMMSNACFNKANTLLSLSDPEGAKPLFDKAYEYALAAGDNIQAMDALRSVMSLTSAAHLRPYARSTFERAKALWHRYHEVNMARIYKDILSDYWKLANETDDKTALKAIEQEVKLVNAQ